MNNRYAVRLMAAMLCLVSVFILCGAQAEEPHEHVYAELIRLREPTCTEAGAAGRVCALCGHEEVEDAIPCLGHDYQDSICAVCRALQNPVSTWTELQAAFRFGGDVTLAADVTAGADDPALTVPAQADVTLHMNSRTLSRGADLTGHAGQRADCGGPFDPFRRGHDHRRQHRQ